MDFIDKLLGFISEAAKVLHMSSSHDAVRSAIQKQIAATFRAENPDSSSYYDYPVVRDTFGDGEEGDVVYSTKGKLTRARYKKSGESYELTKQAPVQLAYVGEAGIQESLVEETIDVVEAAFDSAGRGEVCLIKPCRGSSAVYTAESLQKTAKNKAFPKGTLMFIDHQTETEREAQPEGSMLRAAGVLDGDAEWKNGKVGLGLYAPIKAYADFVPFLNERYQDTGMSVRGSIRTTGRVIDGLPEAAEFAKGLSVDFVTRAGAGGKLLPVYESFRQKRATDPARREGVIDMEVKEADFLALKTQADLVPKLVTRIDRLEESNRRYEVRDLVQAQVAESRLPERAQTRIAKPFLSVTFVPPVAESGALDVAALTAQVKEAIKDETEYLQENGIIRLSPVRGVGEGKETKQPTDDDLDLAAEESLRDTVGDFLEIPVAERKKAS